MHAARPLKLPTSSGNVTDGLPTAGIDFITITAIAGVETGGTNTVTAVLRSGGATGPVIASVTCAAGAAGTGATPINHPVKANAPLYCEIIGSGTLDGSVHVL